MLLLHLGHVGGLMPSTIALNHATCNAEHSMVGSESLLKYLIPPPVQYVVP